MRRPSPPHLLLIPCSLSSPVNRTLVSPTQCKFRGSCSPASEPCASRSISLWSALPWDSSNPFPAWSVIARAFLSVSQAPQLQHNPPMTSIHHSQEAETWEKRAVGVFAPETAPETDRTCHVAFSTGACSPPESDFWIEGAEQGLASRVAIHTPKTRDHAKLVRVSQKVRTLGQKSHASSPILKGSSYWRHDLDFDVTDVMLIIASYFSSIFLRSEHDALRRARAPRFAAGAAPTRGVSATRGGA